MKILPIVIESAGTLITGDVYKQVKPLVIEANNAVVSGEEKRAMVLKTIEQLGWIFGGWVLNLAIELAVAWIKSQRQ